MTTTGSSEHLDSQHHAGGYPDPRAWQGQSVKHKADVLGVVTDTVHLKAAGPGGLRKL